MERKVMSNVRKEMCKEKILLNESFLVQRRKNFQFSLGIWLNWIDELMLAGKFKYKHVYSNEFDRKKSMCIIYWKGTIFLWIINLFIVSVNWTLRSDSKIRFRNISRAQGMCIRNLFRSVLSERISQLSETFREA